MRRVNLKRAAKRDGAAVKRRPKVLSEIKDSQEDAESVFTDFDDKSETVQTPPNGPSKMSDIISDNCQDSTVSSASQIEDPTFASSQVMSTDHITLEPSSLSDLPPSSMDDLSACTTPIPSMNSRGSLPPESPNHLLTTVTNSISNYMEKDEDIMRIDEIKKIISKPEWHLDFMDSQDDSPKTSDLSQPAAPDPQRKYRKCEAKLKEWLDSGKRDKKNDKSKKVAKKGTRTKKCPQKNSDTQNDIMPEKCDVENDILPNMSDPQVTNVTTCRPTNRSGSRKRPTPCEEIRTPKIRKL